MTSSLREALLQRAGQWKVFHDWERNRERDILTLDQRVAWYAAAFELARMLPSNATPRDIAAKANEIRTLRSRLKHLGHGNRNV